MCLSKVCYSHDGRKNEYAQINACYKSCISFVHGTKAFNSSYILLVRSTKWVRKKCNMSVAKALNKQEKFTISLCCSYYFETLKLYIALLCQSAHHASLRLEQRGSEKHTINMSTRAHLHCLVCNSVQFYTFYFRKHIIRRSSSWKLR